MKCDCEMRRNPAIGRPAVRPEPMAMMARGEHVLKRARECRLIHASADE